MQRLVPLLLFLLLVFGVGFSLGVQVAPLNVLLALGFGGSAVLPVLVAYLAAKRQQEAVGAEEH
jgi:hypothetical protein